MKQLKCDVAVTGAGVGGLAAAALLAKEGKKVLVFEKNLTLGGRLAAGFFNGYTIDYGPHLFWPAIKDLLKELNQNIGWNPLGFLKIQIGGNVLEVPHDFREMPKAVKGYLSKKDLKEFENVVDEILAANPDRLDNISSDSFLKKFTKSKKILDMISCLTLIPLTLSDLSQLSAGEVVRAFQYPELFKFMYPKKGSDAIVSALAKAITKKGGRISTDVSVEKILVKRSRAHGLLVKDNLTEELTEVQAKQVIFNLPVYFISEFIDPEIFTKTYLKKLKSLKGLPSAGIALIAGLRKPLFRDSSPLIIHKQKYARYLLCPTNAGVGLPYLFYGHFIEPELLRNKQMILSKSKKLVNEVSELYPNFTSDHDWLITGAVKMVDGLARGPGLTGKYAPSVSSAHVSDLYFVGDSIRGEGNGTRRAINTAKEAVSHIVDTS